MIQSEVTIGNKHAIQPLLISIVARQCAMPARRRQNREEVMGEVWNQREHYYYLLYLGNHRHAQLFTEELDHLVNRAQANNVYFKYS